MNKSLYFFFVYLSFYSFNLFAQTTTIQIDREDGSVIEGYLSAPDNEPNFPVIVLISGSHDVSVFPNHEKLASRFNPCKIGLLSLEKRGISSKTSNREEYLQHDCFEERLQDYILLLKSLEKKAIPGCNGQCIVLGGSEGGKIAPRLSSLFPQNVKGLILIGAGGGLSFAEEMKYQSKQQIRQFNALKRLAYKARGTLSSDEQNAFYAKMLASPNSLEMCGPKTWKWWASYLRYDPLPDLLNIHIPIYMIHGEEDIMVPIQSADLIKAAFDQAQKKNLTYARYPDLGHALTGREDVYDPMIKWIKNLSSSIEEQKK